MSKLTWDNTGERYFETGVSKGVLYPMGVSNTYATGVAWNGLTAVTETPGGAEATDLWADNIKYGTLRSPETFGGTIECYTFPDEWAECNGAAMHATAKGVTIGQQSRKTFGLCYRTNIGNDNDPSAEGAYKLHFIYGATTSPSEKTFNSQSDSPEAVTLSYEYTCNGVNATGYKPVSSLEIDSRTADPECLAELEKKIYGDTDTEPTLPLPDEIITLMTPSGVGG